MSVVQMKQAVKNVYPGKTWENKVNKMSDGQVIAIYYKMLNNKQLK